VVARRSILLALSALLVVALSPAPASAFKRIHHGDPIKVFKKYKRAPRAQASAFSSLFESTWPCTATTSDRASAISSNAPQVKLIYAYPIDVANNFANVDDLMQADAKAVRNRLADESGSNRTIRFDTGGTGGACTANPQRYLDIQTVALSQVKDFYNSPPAGQSTFRRLTDELKSVLPAPAAGARVNYVVYADQVQASGAAGEADILLDDTRSLLNPINQGMAGNGRLFAVVYGNAPAISTGPRQATFLHELTHALGGVQNTAPNTSGAGHCLDEADIMCYDDGAPSTLPPTPVCNTGATPFDFAELYDCNRDDYYNPAPAANSYLGQRWNTYDSVYLCALSDCDSTLTQPGVTVSTTHVAGKLTLQATSADAIAHHEWDTDGDGFFDVDTGGVASLTPSWDSPDTRDVAVRATTATGTFALDTVTVTPTTPVPQFTINGKLAVGETLQLDATNTSDPDGLITSFNWDLNSDNIYETNTGLTRTTSTSFSSPGSVSVGLEVDYSYGASFSRTSPFTITGSGSSGTTNPGGTTTTTTTTPSTTPGTTTPTSGGTTAFAAPTLSLTKVNLKKLLGGGLPLSIVCGVPCTASFKLVVTAKTAKKLKLKSTRIGSLTGQFASGTTRASLTLTAAARKALRKARSLTATLTGSVGQGRLSPLKVTKPLTFKR
jgi:hypothetical protein